MKQLLTIFLIMAATANVFAQHEKVIPAYWVVETNIHQKNFSIVRLYDADNVLVHEVKMNGVYFDVTKPKHIKMLNQLLKGYYTRTPVEKRSKNRKHSKTLLNA